MKKLISVFIFTAFLSFLSNATETQPVNTSGMDNIPNSGGNGPCPTAPSHCQITK